MLFSRITKINSVMLQLELSPKPPSPVSGLAKNFVPTYNGEENAFSIQLFCIDERYEMRYINIVQGVFG